MNNSITKCIQKKQHKYITLVWKLMKISYLKMKIENLQALNNKVFKTCKILEVTKCIWHWTLAFKIELEKIFSEAWVNFSKPSDF